MVKKVLTFYLIGAVVFSPLVQAQTQTTGISSISDSKDPTKVKNIKSLSDVDEVDATKPPQKPQTTSFQRDQQINVHVLGDVKVPGVYKAKVSDRLVDLVNLAQPNRLRLRIVQVRHPNEKTKFVDLYQYYYFGNLEHNPFLKDNDVVFVPKMKGAVRIEGPVFRPGLYEINQEKNLMQIVALAGGFTAARSLNHDIKVIRYDENGKKQLVNVQHDEDRLKDFRIQLGDVYVVPDVINADKEFDYTIETLPGEKIVYPTSVPDVFVIGAVTTPGAYPYKSHLTVKDYIGFAGASANAHLRSVKIVRGNKKKNHKLYASVQAGDVILVREKNLDVFLKYIGITATILSVTTSAIVFQDYIKNR